MRRSMVGPSNAAGGPTRIVDVARASTPAPSDNAHRQRRRSPTRPPRRLADHAASVRNLENTMSNVAIEAVPTSFGNLKPVGHVLVALRNSEAEQAFIGGLYAAGMAQRMTRIEPKEAEDELAELIDNASGASGFGYEIVLMKRYLKLAREGCRWVLVKVDGTDDAQRVGELAAEHDAASAVHYRTLVEEDLLQ
jgi:hypothetical protein